MAAIKVGLFPMALLPLPSTYYFTEYLHSQLFTALRHYSVKTKSEHYHSLKYVLNLSVHKILL